MTLDEAFPITAEERARLDAAPFRGTDEHGWQVFASAVHEQVLKAYAEGEMDFRRMMEVMRSCALGCRLRRPRSERMYLPFSSVSLAPPTAHPAHSSAPPPEAKRLGLDVVLVFGANRLVDVRLVFGDPCRRQRVQRPSVNNLRRYDPGGYGRTSTSSEAAAPPSRHRDSPPGSAA